MIRIGTSGWAYRSWRGDFYPKGLVQRRELAYLAERMSTVELNGSFYSLQRPSSYRSWREQTPEGFEFAVKGGRFITHMKKLRDVETPLANFFASGPLELEDKLGPVLWQLPPSLPFDAERLEAFFRLLPRDSASAYELARAHDDRVDAPRAPTSRRGIRHALEVRHESYRSEEFLSLLREHDVALVVADTAGRWPLMLDVTSDLVYVRLHGHTRLYHGGYDEPLLSEWAQRVADWSREHDVRVYFDNDADGRAPHDAVNLAERVQELRRAARRSAS